MASCRSDPPPPSHFPRRTATTAATSSSFRPPPPSRPRNSTTSSSSSSSSSSTTATAGATATATPPRAPLPPILRDSRSRALRLLLAALPLSLLLLWVSSPLHPLTTLLGFRAATAAAPPTSSFPGLLNHGVSWVLVLGACCFHFVVAGLDPRSCPVVGVELPGSGYLRAFLFGGGGGGAGGRRSSTARMVVRDGVMVRNVNAGAASQNVVLAYRTAWFWWFAAAEAAALVVVVAAAGLLSGDDGNEDGEYAAGREMMMRRRVVVCATVLGMWLLGWQSLEETDRRRVSRFVAGAVAAVLAVVKGVADATGGIGYRRKCCGC